MAIALTSVVFVIVLWWSSTVLVLHLNGLPRKTFPLTLSGAALVMAAAYWGLSETVDETSLAGAWAGFVCAILIWGFNELAFLTGAITGTRKRPCAADCRGLRRFRHATEAILYHELALLASGAAIWLISQGQPNRIGLASFAALWLMRLSSKLNIFLGVPNAGEELLPERVAYLRGFFRQRSMNALFPLSITGLTLGLAFLIYVPASAAGSLDAFELSGFALLATLVALGTLEHWLLVLPLPVDALWRQGLKSRKRPPRIAPAPELRT